MKTGSFGSCVMAAALLGLLMMASGCGRSTGSVAGRVSFKGKMLTGGSVTLVAAGGTRFMARISPDGSYKVPEVSVGPVKIAVISQGPTGLPPVLVPRVPDDVETLPGSAIPANYADADKSGLNYEVTGGEQTHDIELP